MDNSRAFDNYDQWKTASPYDQPEEEEYDDFYYDEAKDNEEFEGWIIIEMGDGSIINMTSNRKMKVKVVNYDLDDPLSNKEASTSLMEEGFSSKYSKTISNIEYDLKQEGRL